MKKILIGFGVVLVLLVGAALIAPSFVDWSKYRAEIANQVKQATGRDLLIGGDIVFSVLPYPVLHVTDVHLANDPSGQSEDMVSIRQLDVSVALMPLLSGQVHVRSIRLIEPVIHLEMLSNGQGNWVLTQSEVSPQSDAQTKPVSATPVVQGSSSSQLPVQIDDLIIEQGRLVYSDLAKGVREEIAQINSRFAIGGLQGPFEAEGTLKARGINLGFEASLGQIVNNRTASFVTNLRLPYGNSTLNLSGTLTQLDETPTVKAKVKMAGQSLAALLSAFDSKSVQPGLLNQPFGMEGDVSLNAKMFDTAQEGINLLLGKDHGVVKIKGTLDPQTSAQVTMHFNKMDVDNWLSLAPYQPVVVDDLPLVIDLTATSSQAGSSYSGVITSQQKSAETPTVKANEKKAVLPDDLEIEVALDIDALIYNKTPIRQMQARIALSEGQLALERFSALFPGAGEVSVFGVAGDKDGQLVFDGVVEAGFAHLRGALEWLGQPMVDVPVGRLQQMNLNTDISLTPKQVTFSNIKATVDGSTLKGAVVAAIQARPSFGATLSLDQINLDSYLGALKSPTPASPGAPSGVADAGAKVTTTETSNSLNGVSAALEELKLLKTFDANLDLSLGKLTYMQQLVRDIYVNASVYDGKLTFKKSGIKSLADVALAIEGAITHTDKGVIAQGLRVSAQAKRLDGVARLAGQEKAMDWGALGPVRLGAQLNGNLLAPDLDLDANLLDSEIAFAGKGDLLPLPKVDGALDVKVEDLGKLSRGFGASWQPAGKPGALSLATDVSYRIPAIELRNLSGKLGQTAFQGQVKRTLVGRPNTDVTLKAGVLDLDALMPAHSAQSKASTNSKASSGASASGTTGGTSPSRWSREKIDLGALRTQDAIINVSMDGLIRQGVRLNNVVVEANLKDGVLDIKKANANAFDGSVMLTSKITAGDVLSVAANTNVSNINVSKLMAGLGSKTQARGTVSLNSQITTNGQSEYDLVRSLDGVANLQASKISTPSGTKGSVLDLVNFLSLLSGRDAAKGVADVTVKSDIAKGVATLTSAQLTSAIASGSANGQVNLPDWTLDVSGTMNVQQNALVGLLAQKANIKSSYPFALSGALDSPNVKLDTGGLGSGNGLVIPLPDKLEKNGVGTLLRGILGGGSTTGSGSNTTNSSSSTTPPTTSGDGSVTPPPPPPGGSSSGSGTTSSKEKLIIDGLNSLFKR